MTYHQLPADDGFTDFQRCVQAHTRTAACGREYVLTERLKRDHFQKRDIQALLNTIYRGQPSAPVTAQTIYQHSRDVLIILLASGFSNLGPIIEVFDNNQIEDRKLPYEHNNLLSLISDGLSPRDAKDVADRFYRTQWRFCPHIFGDRDSVTIDREYILPICEIKPINEKGGTAELFEIVVLEDFVSDSLKQNVSGKAAFSSKQDGDGKRYVFALKTFAESNSHIYQREKEAFDGLRNHSGIVKRLQCFKHRKHRCPEIMELTSPEAPATYNILLEFGELDLEEYFYRNDAPVLQEEIELFWGDLFALARALDGLHNFKSPVTNEMYRGWHADIKPANILSIQGAFKLADPGFAKFERVKDGYQHQTTQLFGGTWTWGAPERLLRGRDAQVTQAIDIWSLGCVFSEAATWILGGNAAVRAFVDVRRNAVMRANRLNKHHERLKTGDCFHDGKGMLTEVKMWHTLFRGSIRSIDHVTGRVLNLIEKKMLLSEPHERINATQLVKELDLIESNAKRQTRCHVPADFLNLLLDADFDSSSYPGPSPDREERLTPQQQMKSPVPADTMNPLLDADVDSSSNSGPSPNREKRLDRQQQKSVLGPASQPTRMPLFLKKYRKTGTISSARTDSYQVTHTQEPSDGKHTEAFAVYNLEWSKLKAWLETAFKNEKFGEADIQGDNYVFKVPAPLTKVQRDAIEALRTES